jgi:pSer/pThr/pTyr-binding forkhead associated (FHA) protein
MPEALLTLLKLFFLALLYLFFFRVLRAVWAELTAPGPAPAQVPASGGQRRSTGAGAPAGGRSGGRSGGVLRLKVVDGPDRRGQVYEVGDETTVGRASGCQIALPDDTFVSQLHARVFRRDGQVFVEDLGSTNGTFLNRKKVSAPIALRRGDRLQVGKTVLEVTR